ncbi:hypothetical protein DFQ28_004804 [Apophysomyces sp. BC1034]|nr:hypothetical protein DFQ28_004804 [Apophysomyces sp. BC1034]
MMFRRFSQCTARCPIWAAGWLAMLVLSGCASYVTSDVIAFNAWSMTDSDRDRTFAFKRDAQQRNSIEQSTYEAQVADDLSHYNFRQVVSASARYSVELAYGTRNGSVIVQQPVYAELWWPAWGRPGPWGPWGPFGMAPMYVDTALPVFVQSLTIRMTERASGKEVYKVSATTPTARQSLPLAMPYLIRSALADFPLQNGGEHAEYDEHERGHRMHRGGRQPVSKTIAQEDRGYICEHHAQRGAHNHAGQVMEPRGQCHGGDLRLVAHFREKKRHQRSAEDAEPCLRRLRVVCAQLVRKEHPCAHRDERQRKCPAHHPGSEQRRQPLAERAGAGMVDQCGGQHAEHDRPGLAVACGEHEGQQLCLVANLGECDTAGRDEKSFGHERCYPQAVDARTTAHMLPALFRQRMDHRSRQARGCARHGPADSAGQVC